MGDTSDDDDTDDATFAAALHFLLHTPHGAGVLRRFFPRGASSTADIEHLAQLIANEWRAYAGANDVSADVEPDSLQPWADEIGEADTHKGTASMDATVIAKGIAETGRSWLTEEELTEKIFAHAQLDRRANESPHQARSRGTSALTTSRAVRSGRPLPWPRAPMCGRLAAMMLRPRRLTPSCKSWPSSTVLAIRI